MCYKMCLIHKNTLIFLAQQCAVAMTHFKLTYNFADAKPIYLNRELSKWTVVIECVCDFQIRMNPNTLNNSPSIWVI